ncbi:MAG: hypothetical protein AAGD08_19630 [Pseudomonadota bacterium]
MTILNRMEVVHGDIRSVQADLLVVKYANYSFGADEAIRAALGVEIHVVKGHRSILPGRGLIGAKEVAFLGVGDLWEFRYERIRNFGARTLTLLADERPEAQSVATTIHGLGYGLDEREAFLSQLEGMLEVEIDLARLTLRRIVFVEHNLKRAQRLSETLAKRHRQEASRFHDQLERPPVQAPAPKTDRDGSGQRFVPGTQFARVQVEAFGPEARKSRNSSSPCPSPTSTGTNMISRS